MATFLNKKYIPFIVLVLFGLLMFMMGILNHYYFRTVTYDYGNYNFAFWDYSHFRISKLPTHDKTFLQDHFSFTLMYFIPVFWLLNWVSGTYTLIIIQQAMVIVGAWYTYQIVKLRSDNLWLTTGVVAYYFLLLGRYTTFLSDVNLAVISSCFIPIFIYYFELKKYYYSLLVLFLSLLSRENIPLWYIFIYLVLIINHRNNKIAVRHGLLGIVISVVYFITLFKIVIPATKPPNIDYALFNYSALGSTPGEALIYMLKNPIESVKLFFINHLDNPLYDGVKAEFYWVYLISGGFVLLFRPQYIIWFIPVVAQKVLNDSYIRWGIGTYYSIEVVTLLPISVFTVISEIPKRKFQIFLTILVCVSTLSMTIYKMDRVNCKVPWLVNTSKIKPYSKDFYEAPFNIKKVNQLLDKIPPNAKVSASSKLLPHLAQRNYIYYFPKVADAEYIVFSVLDDNYLHSKEINERERKKYLTDPNWEIIEKEFPVILLKYNNGIKNDRIKINIDNIWGKIDTLNCNFELFDAQKKHVLLSDKISKADTLIHITNDEFLSEKHSLVLTPEKPYSHSIQLKNIDKTEMLEISVWRKSDENKGFIVIDGEDEFYLTSKPDTTSSINGWKKQTLKCNLPKNTNSENTKIYLWNPGDKPAYFDDLKIIISRKQ